MQEQSPELEHYNEQEKIDQEAREALERLQSPECIQRQKNLQVALIRTETALRKASEILDNRKKYQENLAFVLGGLIDQHIGTLPEQSNIPAHDPRSDPRRIIATLREESNEYNKRYAHDAVTVLESIAGFCKDYQLDFHPYLGEHLRAPDIWRELQKAFAARMFELQNRKTYRKHELHEI